MSLARRAEAETIANEHPGIVQGLPDLDRELVAKYCWETNTNYEAVKLMLDLGFPVAHPERQPWLYAAAQRCLGGFG